ncbi:AEC family transporter [Thiofilum flexile]|uniref:AEC family transporter n=1 Tax=Thiofilum flexile TaxID=125627 RepID=UPI0003798BD9|nr:AEC family transporter [Thiofilum flexile]
MSTVFLAIMPIFIFLLLGYVALKTDFIVASTWIQIEKATYFALFPCLLINQLANAQIDWSSASYLILFAVLIPILGSVLAFAAQYFLKHDGASFTSDYQGSIRFNTYIGLALIFALLPREATPLAAIVIAIMIPWINVLCILVFARYAKGVPNTKAILQQMARNPLILGSLIGLILNLSEWHLPSVVNEVFKRLGDMTLPLGLLTVGAGLKWRSFQAYTKSLVSSSVIKLLILPLLILGIGLALELNALTLAVVVILAALPTASSAYILARQLGGNADLMAAIITVQTLVALLSLPLVLWCLSRVGG